MKHDNIKMKNLLSILQKKDVGIALIDVVFGSPSLDCEGFGICKIDVIPYTNYKRRESACKCGKSGIGKLIYSELGLKLELQKDSIQTATFQKQFGNGNFILMEDFEFNPKTYWPNLELPDCKVIKSGAYPFEDTGPRLLIEFKKL